jgi:hypothetical protein
MRSARTFSQHDGTRPFDSIPAASTTFLLVLLKGVRVFQTLSDHPVT